MDEECEGCEGCDDCMVVEIPAASWSWPWLLEAFFQLLACLAVDFADFFSTGFARQFAMMHNRKINRDDQRDVAEDVMATIHQLPTKE